MKTSAYLVSLFFASLAASSPLGDRALFGRHDGVTRSFVLRSATKAPSTCATRTSPPITDNSTITPDLTSGDNSTTVVDPTSSDNSTAVADPTSDNSTAVADPTSSDNSTAVADNSTDAAGASRRFLSKEVSEWQTLCSASGGGIYSSFDEDAGLGCVNWAGIDAVSALYAEADPCEQQENADFMITWAKTFGGSSTDILISQAIRYRRYPRRVVKVLGVFPSSPYCLLEPFNTELFGIYNEQLTGVDYGLYGGPNYPFVSFGGDGTCPLGWSADVSSCSCISDNSTDTSLGDFGSATITSDASAATETSDATDASTDDTDDTSTDDTSTDDTSTDDTSTDDTATDTATDDTATDTAAAAAPTATSEIDGDINDPSG